MITLQKRAKLALKHFEQAKRADDTTYWKHKDKCPQWVIDMCYKAHVGMLPDDYKYEYIVSALYAISEHNTIDAARDDIEADIYTSDLLRWLASNTTRLIYCDESIAEFGRTDAGIEHTISLGQWLERREVFDIVAGCLEVRDNRKGCKV